MGVEKKKGFVKAAISRAVCCPFKEHFHCVFFWYTFKLQAFYIHSWSLHVHVYSQLTVLISFHMSNKRRLASLAAIFVLSLDGRISAWRDNFLKRLCGRLSGGMLCVKFTVKTYIRVMSELLSLISFEANQSCIKPLSLSNLPFSRISLMIVKSLILVSRFLLKQFVFPQL